VYRPTSEGSRVRIGGRYDEPDRFLASRSDRWWCNYHVFSVEWTPTEYVFRIDGHETWRTSEGISHHPQFLILSLLSSDYELPDNPSAAPEHAYVDWVQFWRARGS
jgi:Glycosyl hydrolases family 16